MTSAIETALTELSANLRRMEQRHQAVGYKFDRLYDLIDAAREELAGTAHTLPPQYSAFADELQRLTEQLKADRPDAIRYRALRALAGEEQVTLFGSYYDLEHFDAEIDQHIEERKS